MPFLGSQPAETALTTGDLADDIVTLAKLAGGTDGNLITYDASGDPVAVAVGTAGHFLKSQGAGSVPVFAAAGGFTLGTEAATGSGTSVDFTGIPAGTKVVHVLFEGVDLSDTSDLDVVLGDSGGLETSGYTGGSQRQSTGVTSTASFNINRASATDDLFTGIMALSLKDSTNNTWCQFHAGMNAANATGYNGGGAKSLSGALTQIRVEGGTFDGGSVNVLYF